MRRLLRNLAIYAFHISFVRPVLRFGAGVRYRGRSRVPRGPCVVVSNHNSHLDAAVLMSLFPLKRLPHVHPVAAADYFGNSWLLRTMAMLFMNGIPIERKAKSADPMGPIAEHLKRGESLVLFPEGSRGEAGVISRFRPGVGQLAQKVPGLLILPVFLSGPERIWPRGQMVPVPLNIDAIVGRPRSYPPDQDPRLTAEQLQRDVMSLAPPPPPVPASRPSPPVRVAICGLDRESREGLFRRLCERLGRTERTLGIGDPLLEADDEGVREMIAPIPYAPARAWLGPLAWLFRTSGRFKGQKFVQMVERAQIDEALGGDRSARFVVTHGSALVDVLAWAEADFYEGRFDDSGINHLLQYLSGQKKIRPANWWRFIRNAPEVWLVNTFDLARPPVPDVLVHLSLPASTLMQRLRSHGDELQAHENEAFLDRLQQGYRHVGEVLRKRRKVELFEYDLSIVDPETILDEVEAICRRLIESNESASSPA